MASRHKLPSKSAESQGPESHDQARKRGDGLDRTWSEKEWLDNNRLDAEAQTRASATRTQQSKSGPVKKIQPDPAEGDRAAVERDLKQQTEQRKAHEKAEVHADRPRDRKLKAERKGVI